MGIEVNGMGGIFEDLEDLQESFGDDGVMWEVGTDKEYAKFLEFGTDPHTITPDDAEALRWEDAEGVHFAAEVHHPGIDPKPFFRPAVAEVRAMGPINFIETHTQKTEETIDSTEEFVSSLALALKKRIREIITEKGLIDTGALRASVDAVPISNV